MAVLFEKTKLLSDKQFHYCPGCNHGIIHRLVAEVIDEMHLRENVSFCGEIRYSEVILACRLRPDESYGAGTDEVRVERRGKSSPDGV